MVELLTILGDETGGGSNENTEDFRAATVTEAQMVAMRRNWEAADDDDLRNRVVELRTLYDWQALKAVINVCPDSPKGDFEMADLFNILDMHIQSGHGFPTHSRQFLTPQRVLSARNALVMLLQTLFYINWHREGKRRGHPNVTSPKR